MEEKYTIYRRTTINSTGCPEDESLTSTTRSELFLVPESQEDDFGENIASDCGDQDYNYQVKYDEIAEIKGNELLGLQEEISKVFNNAKKKFTEYQISGAMKILQLDRATVLERLNISEQDVQK